MGLLTDLGNFATGAIERDKELTNEKLAIRAEELKANSLKFRSIAQIKSDVFSSIEVLCSTCRCCSSKFSRTVSIIGLAKNLYKTNRVIAKEKIASVIKYFKL